MRRLILFRHAKAEPRAAGGEDVERPLAERGRRDATLMGQVLARKGLIPDLALVSAARRTQETWEALELAFPGARVEVSQGLYNATPEEMWAEVEACAGEGDVVMVVGHNPGIHELAVNLVAEGCGSASEIDRVAAKFPTSTAAAFHLDPDGRTAFDGLYLAKDFGGEGE